MARTSIDPSLLDPTISISKGGTGVTSFTNYSVITANSSDSALVGNSNITTDVNGLLYANKGLRVTSTVSPTTGAGLELNYNSGNTIGYISSYNRDSSAYEIFDIFASSINLIFGASTTQLTVDTNGITVPSLTSNTAITVNGSKVLTSSSTTDTELGYVHGVTSAIQTQINSKAASSGQQFTGDISFDSSSHGILAITTNSPILGGHVGFIVSTSASSISFPASATWGDLVNISLAAGNWSITINGYAIPNGGTTTEFEMGISTTSGNSSTGLVFGTNAGNYPFSSAISDGTSGCIANYDVSLASSTTYYFKFLAVYSAGTPKFSGFMRVIRTS